MITYHPQFDNILYKYCHKGNTRVYVIKVTFYRKNTELSPKPLHCIDSWSKMCTYPERLYMDIQSIKQLTQAERDLGLQRLGRVLTLSMSIQNLSTRDVENLTKRLFIVGISKDSVVKLRKGHTSPELDTYRRLAVVCFKVDHFIYTETDKVGKPVLLYKGGDYKGVFDKDIRIQQATDQKDLPDYEYRTLDHTRLLRIVTGQVEYKEVRDFALV